ncbi:MAG: hypothetical protein JSS32_09360 [Verrucomicrobia bacterium]|nr:hypothetical protein [Verrucomicrobiota bacterium]
MSSDFSVSRALAPIICGAYLAINASTDTSSDAKMAKYAGSLAAIILGTFEICRSLCPSKPHENEADSEEEIIVEKSKENVREMSHADLQLFKTEPGKFDGFGREEFFTFSNQSERRVNKRYFRSRQIANLNKYVTAPTEDEKKHIPERTAKRIQFSLNRQ